MNQQRQGHPLSRRVAVILAVSAAVGTAVSTAAEAACEVTSPVLGQVSPADLERGVEGDVVSEFVFSGSVNLNFQLGELSLDVQVLEPAGATLDEGNWKTVSSLDAPSGASTFVFSTNIAPFEGKPEAWKPGGLGRLRSKVVDKTMGDSRLLTVCDADGLTPVNESIIVLADTSPDPTLPPGEIQSSIRNPFNRRTPNYLTANLAVQWFPPGQIEMQREAARPCLQTARCWI